MPRIGEEVAIDWVGGDCDRPIATGRVYNGATQPHWHSNGILSGFRSREYGGAGGFNQLVMDDATAQNRLQLLQELRAAIMAARTVSRMAVVPDERTLFSDLFAEAASG